MIKFEIDNKDGIYGISEKVYPVIVTGKNDEKLLAIFTKSQIQIAVKRGLKFKDLKEQLLSKTDDNDLTFVFK